MYICASCMYICVYIHLYTYMCYLYDLCAMYVLYMIWHVCVYIYNVAYIHVLCMYVCLLKPNISLEFTVYIFPFFNE